MPNTQKSLDGCSELTTHEWEWSTVVRVSYCYDEKAADMFWVLDCAGGETIVLTSSGMIKAWKQNEPS